MTSKLKKINEVTGKLIDLYPNLLIVDDKNIAVPVDKLHIVKSMEAGLGDTVHITYDDRGYLLDAKLVVKGAPLRKGGEQP